MLKIRSSMLVQLADITFGYAGEDLFSGLTWQINPGEHIGLVGPNGAGKSTLLRLIAGKLEPEAGNVARRRGVTIAYLHQSQEFTGEGTIFHALLAPFADVVALRDELDVLAARLETSHDEKDLERYGHVEELFRAKEGYALEARVRELAMDVGFGSEELGRSVETLSGGERNRLELAKVLLAAPDLLLLDEPTNHLDMAACERLEGFLSNYGGAFVLVSHDRTFLDAVCKEIVEVDEGQLDRYVGGWRAYVDGRDRRRELARAAYERQKEEIARTEDFIRRNIAGQNTKQAQARRKMLAKVERLEWQADMWQQAGRIGLRFDPGDRPGGKEMLVAEKLDAGYEKPLVAKLDLVVYRGDRIGIVGPNGAGKSTLLKTFLGMTPALAGNVRRGQDVRVGYFDQKLGGLDDDRTLIDEIRAVRGDLSPDSVRQYLAKFRFFGDDVFRVVRGLSGGERNRLALGKMMLRPANLLALDEPTNHLDIPSREVLEKALRAYEGTLLVVSHDRFFLDEVATKILVLDGAGGTTLELGNYSDWRHRRARQAAAAAATAAAAAARGVARPASETQQKKDWEDAKARAAARGKLERRLATLEEQIAKAETQLEEVRGRLAGEHGGDWQKLHGLVEEERRLADKLRSLLGEWEKVGEELAR